MTFTPKSICFAATLLSAAALTAGTAQATVVFSDLPTNESTLMSFHNTDGPVLADDFIPTASGVVSAVDWWGSAVTNTNWELALHTNAALSGQPNIDSITAGSTFKYMVTAVGVQDATAPADLYHYRAELSGPLMAITAGTDYWFTVANAATGWNWADALNGPSIGAEIFNAHSSVGGANLCGDGGPHCGPWLDRHTDLAFAVTAVPEPSTYALMLLGLAGLGAVARKRKAGSPARDITV